MTNTLDDKFEKLMGILNSFDSMIVAFSGGVDSTLLLSAACEKLGDRVTAATVESIVHKASETERARALALDLGVEHVVIKANELEIPEFVSNGPDRCYHCKKAIINRLMDLARSGDVKVVTHGANADDLNDFRPGQRAAEEARIRAPLLEAGLTKKDIRTLSRKRGLPTWNLPAMACLATRIPYGTNITVQNLAAVRDAEIALERLGFPSARVRHHGTTARIELPLSSFDGIMEPSLREAVVGALISVGFSHVSLDLEGYVSGKMNRGVPGA